MNGILYRIVAMLTRMAMKFDGVAESRAEYNAGIDCDYEHRFAEHEHEHETRTEETPEQCRPPKRPKDIFFEHKLQHGG